MPRTFAILPASRLGPALSPEVFAEPTRPANMARFIFLNPRAADFFADWQGIANDAVAILSGESVGEWAGFLATASRGNGRAGLGLADTGCAAERSLMHVERTLPVGGHFRSKSGRTRR